MTSNRFFPSPPSPLPLPVAFLTGATEVDGASVISTSAMVLLIRSLWWRGSMEVDEPGGGVVKGEVELGPGEKIQRAVFSLWKGGVMARRWRNEGADTLQRMC